MPSILSFLILILFAAPSFAAPPNTHSQPTDYFDLCRTGVKGGDYNETTKKFGWTCANYNWSGEMGGFDENGVASSDPTTPGGNSWTMVCTGDGVGAPENGGTATSYEQGVCLHAGERVKMYSMADIQLAIDATEMHGGEIYLPRGLYHDAYCGQQPDGTGNGCPVIKSDPTRQIRKWTLWGGRKLKGEGPDPDGPHLGGGRTGTYLISDHGTDADDDGDFSDDWGGGSTEWANITGDHVNYESGHWAWFLGRKADYVICAWPSTDSEGCVVNGSTVGNWDHKGKGLIGRGDSTGTIIADIGAINTGGSGFTSACIEDDLAQSGVCSGDVRVRCNDDTEVRTGWGGGGCPGSLGSCIGYATAIEQIIDERSTETTGATLVGKIDTYQKNRYAGTGAEVPDEVGNDSTSKSYYGNIVGVGGTCATTGRYVEFGLNQDFETQEQFGLTDFPKYEIDVQPGTFIVLDWNTFDNRQGGVYDLTVMPAQWRYRDSPNLDAECGQEVATGLESGGIACDQLEKVNLSGDWGGEWNNIVSWYGGGGDNGAYQFSEQDGDPGAYGGRVINSTFAQGAGLIADASSWSLINNLFWGWDSTGRTLLKVCFNPGCINQGNKFLNNYASSAYGTQRGSGGVIRDEEFIGNEFVLGMFDFSGTRGVVVDNISGYGNTGRVLAFQIQDESGTGGASPPYEEDMWNISVSNVRLENQRMRDVNDMQGVIVVTDINGLYTTGGYHGYIDIRNFGVELYSAVGGTVDNICGVFFGGGSGDESDADNGSGRVVDDVRNHFNFENIDISYWDNDAGGGSATESFHFCFGNETAAWQDPDDANVIESIWDTAIAGPLPSWRNYRVQNVPLPDNPHQSMTSEEAGDCGDLRPGVVVLVHDQDTAGACEDTDADGVMDPEAADDAGFSSYCTCSAAGTWSAF